jgi:hypothetical protein
MAGVLFPPWSRPGQAPARIGLASRTPPSCSQVAPFLLPLLGFLLSSMAERPLHLWSTSSRARLFTDELPGAAPGSLPEDLAARAFLCSAALTPAPCSAMEDAPRAQVPARPSAPARAPMSMPRSQCRAPAAPLSLSMAAESLCARLALKFVPAAPCSDPLPLRGSRLSAQLAPALLSRRSPASVCHAWRTLSLAHVPNPVGSSLSLGVVPSSSSGSTCRSDSRHPLLGPLLGHGT